MSLHILCPHCGTEFDVADTSESTEMQKMPTDGTYFLIPKDIKNKTIDIKELINNLSKATVSDSGDIIIPQNNTKTKNVEHTNVLQNTSQEFIDTLDDIEKNIVNNGYIANNNLWRRWIMAQMLRHYRETLTNINKHLLSELEDLFMLLW